MIKKSPQPDRALQFVAVLALTIVLTVMVCSLIWWFTGDHSYDILGRYISIGGVILIAFGTISMGGRGYVAFRKNTGTEGNGNHKEAIRRGNSADKTRPATLVVLNLFGAGLLCLFIGNLILLGL
ncbi:MAG: hypothetical protein WCF08_06035 [Anaerolineaceae bacterium]